MPFHRFQLVVFLLSCVSLLSTGDVQAQADPPIPEPTLRAEIAAADSVMFSAFNTRDLETLRAMFTKDLEFYHDQSGLTGYADNITAFEALFSRDDGLRRDLVPGSLEVYPVKDYGAIEVGEHTFCHEEGGVEDCGTFPFVMIWRNVDGAWKVARVVSYGH